MRSNKRITLAVFIMVAFLVMLCSTQRVTLLFSPISSTNIEKNISSSGDESSLSAPSAKLCDISKKSLVSSSLDIADDSVFFIVTLFIMLLPLLMSSKRELFFLQPPIFLTPTRIHIRLCVFRE